MIYTLKYERGMVTAGMVWGIPIVDEIEEVFAEASEIDAARRQQPEMVASR